MALRIYSTESYAGLRDAVCFFGRFEPGRIETQVFPDGERYQRILTPPEGHEAVLLAGATSDEETAQIFDLATGLVENGAARLILLLPYFAYSTMDRAGEPGEIVTAKTRASLFSAIPRAARGNRVLVLDPHSDGLPHYFAPGLGATAIGIESLVERIARRVGNHGFVLASADAGRAKWVQRIARHMDVPAAFVHKRRLGPDRTEVVALVADVRGKTVVICDDMIRTGASMLGAAQAYRDAGAARVFAIATHGVLPGDALARLEFSGLIEQLFTTDSHPRATALAGRFLRIESVAALLTESLSAEVALEDSHSSRFHATQLLHD